MDEELGQASCGVGICANTVDNCVGGVEQPCAPLDLAVDEVCNGLDDDCDGATDEQLGRTTCGDGVCQTSVKSCVGGIEQPCVPLDVATDETCDGLDDDCDGLIDEEMDAACADEFGEPYACFKGSCQPVCRYAVNCLGLPWTVKCGGHWDCVENVCQEVCGEPCGDLTCQPYKGESAASCAADCTNCATNEECLYDEFCELQAGACGEPGSCLVAPLSCPFTWDPVCGCDGVTWDNDCVRQQAGVSLMYLGECASDCVEDVDCLGQDFPIDCKGHWDCVNNTCDPVCGEPCGDGVCSPELGEDERSCLTDCGCMSHDDCDANHGCVFADGQCAGPGRCKLYPDLCPPLLDPVCGCDDVTYPNRCVARGAGVSVLHEGECAQPECVMDEDCLALPWEVDCQGHWDCKEGTCAASCGAPCGDGICEPGAGESDDTCMSDCGVCHEDMDCPFDEFCRFAYGDCLGDGACSVYPMTCSPVWDPVCGCDGATYANECSAAMLGVSVAHAGECVSVCTSNAECAETAYCVFDAGCGGEGTCQDRPGDCAVEWSPVCGCDGVTYSSECVAAKAGVVVQHTGMCAPTTCQDNSACDADAFCFFKQSQSCAGEGTCVSRPVDCGNSQKTVCGCDGVTYQNKCRAYQAGASVASEGACPPVTCTSSTECGAMEYCAKAAGDCEGEGACELLPDLCTPTWDPVCGCDGATHYNACMAAAASINVDYAGECAMPIEPSGFRLIDLAFAEPTLCLDFGTGECVAMTEIVNALILGELNSASAPLDLLGVFTPLDLLLADAGFSLMEATCARDAVGEITGCVADPTLDPNAFDSPSFATDGLCLEQPMAIGAPCFRASAPDARLRILGMLFGLFEPVVSGSFDPNLAQIKPGVIHGFMPKANAALIGFDLGGTLYTLADMLSHEPPVEWEGITGWWLTLTFSAVEVPFTWL